MVHLVNEFCAEGMEGARPFCDVTLAADVAYDADATVSCLACLGGAEDMKIHVARIYYQATHDPGSKYESVDKRDAIRRFWKISKERT